jgi:hypothetical protein
MRATGVTPTIDVGLVRELQAGRVTPVPARIRLDGDAAVLADGTRLTPDVVIAATGYSTALEPVVGHHRCAGRRSGRRQGAEGPPPLTADSWPLDQVYTRCIPWV